MSRDELMRHRERRDDMSPRAPTSDEDAKRSQGFVFCSRCVNAHLFYRMVRREEGELCANRPELRRLTASIGLHTTMHFRGCALYCEGCDLLQKHFWMNRLGEDFEFMPHASSAIQLVRLP